MEFNKDKMREVIEEIFDKHQEQIEKNESFQQLLTKLAEENDLRWNIVQELCNIVKSFHEIGLEQLSIIRAIAHIGSANEIALREMEKKTEKHIKWSDNLQDQIDILAKDIYERKEDADGMDKVNPKDDESR